jgi:outer membrane protein assembly complex protein YaeT
VIRRAIPLLIILTLTSSAAAQVPVELRGRRIVDVEIAGETAGITSPRDVGVPLGVPLSRRLLRSTIRRLAANGRWRDVQLDLVAVRGGVKVVAHLVPVVILSRVEVRGNDEIGDSEILRTVGIGEGSELLEDTVDQVVTAASQAYGEIGYENAQIEVIVRDTDDPSRKVMRIVVREGEPTRIARVQFQGESPPRGSGAASGLSFEEGDVLDREAIVESIRETELEMRKRGWLEAELGPAIVARAVGGGVIVSIPSRPGPLYEVRYRNIAPIDRGDLEDILELGEEPLTDALVDGIRERVIDVYQRHGFYDADATVRRIAGPEEGTAYLDISARPGPPLRVVETTFPGAHHFDAERLLSELRGYLDDDLPRAEPLEPVDSAVVDSAFRHSIQRRREFAPPLNSDPHTVFYEPTYEAGIEHITELYALDGYLSATVGPLKMRRTENGTARVEIPVVEGPRTTLLHVDIDGNEALTTHEILVAAELSRGQPFSPLALEEARLRIVDLYQERGFLFVRVEPTILYSADQTRAEVSITVVEAFEVRVGRVIVRGAVNTSDALIRDRIVLEPDELFRPSLVRTSQERLLELGVFSGVNIGVADPDLPARIKDVVVTVAERKPQYLDFTAGFSTGQGLRGGFEYGYRNLFGYGVTTSIQVQLGFQFLFVNPVLETRYEALSLQDRLERNIAVGIAVPHIPGIENVRAGLNVYHRRNNEFDFGIDNNGVSLTASWRAIRQVSLSGAANLENSNVQLFTNNQNLEEYLMMMMEMGMVNQRLVRLLRVPDGESTILAFPLTLALDLRDNPLDPSAGFFGSITGEYAVTLSAEPQGAMMEPFESNFIKLTFTTRGYIPILDDIVFAISARFGRVFHLDENSETYPNRAYFLGGVETMRGYFQDAMIPQDKAEVVINDPNIGPNDVVRAGDTFILFRGELRFPIFGPIYGGVFTDIGNLWSDPRFFDLFALRPTAGVGLRVKTPVGPLALDYGLLLLRREELQEPVGTFHFSIGLF